MQQHIDNFGKFLPAPIYSKCLWNVSPRMLESIFSDSVAIDFDTTHFHDSIEISISLLSFNFD